jgi:hypothetical protein
MAHLLIIAVVIVVVVVVACAFYFFSTTDDLGDRATSSDIAIIEAKVSVDMGYALGSAWGTAEMKTSVSYDTGKGEGWDWPTFSLFNPEHKLKVEVRCTGPGDYIETHHQTKKFNGYIASVEYDFDTLRFPVEEPGSYRLTVKVTLDGADFCSGAEMVTVNAQD